MNHDVLRKRGHRLGQEINPQLRREASEEHRKLANAYEHYELPLPNDAIAPLVKKTATLLYVVRSNIAHGEKAALANPNSEEAKRDDEVARKTIPVQLKLLDLIFNKPDQKLVVYGILAPGAPGEHILEEIGGDWQQCKIAGSIFSHEGLKYYKEYPEMSEINCRLFFSKFLPEGWASIDAFEGSNYNRILIPAKIADHWVVANVYEGREFESGL